MRRHDVASIANRSPSRGEREDGQGSDFESLDGAQLVTLLEEARGVVFRLERALAATGDLDQQVHPLTSWRRRRGLRMRDLAEMVGITAPGIWRIEHLPGFAARPGTRGRIAQALNVTEEELTQR